MTSNQIWFLAGCFVWGAALVVWSLMRRDHRRMLEWAREWDRQSEDAHQRHMAEMALAMRTPRWVQKRGQA